MTALTRIFVFFLDSINTILPLMPCGRVASEAQLKRQPSDLFEQNTPSLQELRTEYYSDCVRASACVRMSLRKKKFRDSGAQERRPPTTDFVI